MSVQTKQITPDLQTILKEAENEAARRHGNYVDVEHLALALLRYSSGAAKVLFDQAGVDTSALYAEIAGQIGMERPTSAPVKGLSKSAQVVMERAVRESSSLGQGSLNSGHLLMGLLQELNGVVHDAFAGTSLTFDSVRAYLRDHIPASVPVSTSTRERVTSRPPDVQPDDPKIVVVPFRQGRARSAPRQAGQAQPRSRAPYILAAVLALVLYLVFVLPGDRLFTFSVVVVGWIFSLCLHEFSHALVAYLGGDYTVKDKGYLTFNPLKYTHPMLSIVMPLLFLAMGGIGLPGGAVYIERQRLGVNPIIGKNLSFRAWNSLVSAAGPFSNIVFTIVLLIPFKLGIYNYTDPIWSAVAFLAELQIISIVLNLLPIPPLDGFGIIEPFLDTRTQMQLRQFGGFSFLLLILILWTPLGHPFWQMIEHISVSVGIPQYLVSKGYWDFMFWRPRQ